MNIDSNLTFILFVAIICLNVVLYHAVDIRHVKARVMLEEAKRRLIEAGGTPETPSEQK